MQVSPRSKSSPASVRGSAPLRRAKRHAVIAAIADAGFVAAMVSTPAAASRQAVLRSTSPAPYRIRFIAIDISSG